ncbi:MAG: hypothetical protein ACRD2T_05245, partial [Thermoanaerobaculia bacterium]
VNSHRKLIDGREMYPHMHGDQGWYAYSPARYGHGALEVYYWSMRREDRERLPAEGWLAFLDGKASGYPEEALRRDLDLVRRRVEGLRRDPTTPDTRLADDPLKFNPAAVGSLIQLALGGLDPGNRGTVLHARLRYFDPERRRAGLPEDVAALVEGFGAEEATVTLVNIHQTQPRTVVVQGGTYGEHRFTGARWGERSLALDAARLTVRLAPGAGGKLVLGMKRYANPPRLTFPWSG